MISIVIPAFNEERLLPRCLKSLENQDYPGEYEIVVADNCSADATKKVAKQFHARVVTCTERGVFQTRQAGAEAAYGDIIVQADADTIYPADWLSRIARHFETHPKSVALAGRYAYEKPPYWAKLEYVLRYIANLICWVFARHPGSISGANFAFRHDAFLRVGGYNLGGISPDQWGIAHRLRKVGKISYDHNLVVLTSQRRVRKTFLKITGEFWINAGRASLYFLKYLLGLNKEPAMQPMPRPKRKPQRIPVRSID